MGDLFKSREACTLDLSGIDQLSDEFFFVAKTVLQVAPYRTSATFYSTPSTPSTPCTPCTPCTPSTPSTPLVRIDSACAPSFCHSVTVTVTLCCQSPFSILNPHSSTSANPSCDSCALTCYSILRLQYFEHSLLTHYLITLCISNWLCYNENRQGPKDFFWARRASNP